MFDAFSQPAKNEEEVSHSLFQDVDFEVDADMHRLVIRVESVCGIQSIQLVN